MNEIYWITRLDALSMLFAFMVGIPMICSFVWFLINHSEGKDTRAGWKKCRIASFVIGVLGLVFVPSKSDALLILGVGGAVDYIRSNETAKQLPDKCVDALDAWVESLSEDKRGETK